jgi:hypothetical protein
VALTSIFRSFRALVLPAPPGVGQYPLPIATLGFDLLLAALFVFLVMFGVLRIAYPKRKRALEGYMEASGVNLIFLVFAVFLVFAIHQADPSGNLTSWALYETILGGYWLAIAIPVVTVGSSVHTKTRGGVPWLLPSIIAAIVLFFVVWGIYYYGISPD